MAFHYPLPLLLLFSYTISLFLPCLVEAVQGEPEVVNGSTTWPSIPVGTLDPPTAFPLPVTSYGVYWWIYSPEQMRDYGETFRVLPYVMPRSLPLDPKRIWPGVPLDKIGDLKWNETLDSNPQYRPNIKTYLKDWYTALVEALSGPDSQIMLDYFANDKYFTYIRFPSDVQSIIRERALLAAKYNSWRPPPDNVSTSEFTNTFAKTTPLSTSFTNETMTFHDSTVTSSPTTDSTSSEIASGNPINTNESTPINNSEEDYLMDTDSESEDCTEDEFEDPAPSFVNRVIADTLAGAKEFEGRAVSLFYRLAMTSYLSNEDKAKDAIKCVLGLDCGVPSFIKGMLQDQGLSILVHGACSPGACSAETEEIARTFRDQLAATYPALFSTTLDLIRDLGKQGNHMGVAGTKLPV